MGVARLLFLAAATIFAAAAVHAQPPQRTVGVYVFWRAGCPHCERALDFLRREAARDQAVRLRSFEVFRKPNDAQLMVSVAGRLGVESGSVPLTVIGDRAWIGYLDDASTGAEMATRIRACRASSCPDTVAGLISGKADAGPPAASQPLRLPEALRVPLIGEVRTAHLSLPVLTVLLGAVDGFNPCAMWVLVFLLGLLAGMRDRTRMWVLGGAFVLASALVYLLILGAWLNLLLFLGAIVWVRLAIGAVALGVGGWYLKEFVANPAMACAVTAPEERRRVFARLRELALQRDFLAALGGIVLLAAAVNVVEFLCSAGIPAVFTQLLALSKLPAWQHAAYLVLYVTVFMLDDLLVLVIALKTLEVTGMTSTYARWSNLIGGVVLLLIGALLILRPEWLTFAP